MGVAAAQLLRRLLQNAGSLKAVQKRENFPKKGFKEIINQINSGNLQKSMTLLGAFSLSLPSSLYLRLLQLCAEKSAIVEARKTESHIVRFDPSPRIFLLNRVIETYGKCGTVTDARELFDEMPDRNGGSWNAMVVAHSRAGSPEDVISFFSVMNRAGILANEITYAVVLSSCGDALEMLLGRQIHGVIVKRGFLGNVILESSLVDVYGKCASASIDDARRIFEGIESKNSVSWNVIVRRYLEAGEESEALEMFARMIREGFMPLNFTFSNALICCCRIRALKEGQQIHSFAVKSSVIEDDVVSVSLLEMYTKCVFLEDARLIFNVHGPKNVFTETSLLSECAKRGRIQDAEQLFDEMSHRSIVSWNALLAAYIRSLSWDKALELAKRMVEEAGVGEIDHVSVCMLLNLCAGLSDSFLGREVHAFACRRGFIFNHLVGNVLLDMYGKCGCFKSAELAFRLMASFRDVISWNALLSNYARHGRSKEALVIFGRMQAETAPSKFTLSAALAASSDMSSLEQGKQIHGYLFRHGCECDMVVQGALVDMYSKCRHLDYARKVFDEGPRDLVLWNSMIFGYACNGCGSEVPKMFEKMQEEGVSADGVTFLGILQACANSGSVVAGYKFFKSMSEVHCITPWMEHYECMIEILAKYGKPGEVREFISRLPFEPTDSMWARLSD